MKKIDKTIEFKLRIEPVAFTIINKVEDDMAMFGIENDDFVHAVYNWLNNKMKEYPEPPGWLWDEISQEPEQ